MNYKEARRQFAAKVSQLRRQKRITQDELAELIDKTNDAIDAEGKEYELKTINISLNRSGGVTTHHHLNEIILEKYRKVGAWYIGLHEGITLKQIYKLTPELLEPKFKEWEEKLKVRNDALNNPKIPLKLVRRGELVYSDSQG
ncbi:MAG: hypothetical protein EAZ78_08050 [Oscillatoriales cyanobacterium]|uniref:hypothetical protein n=1 Tax=Microcoleus anatoxicus TaxID=2705319 RepID=UPI002972AAD4|nr:MAG: hypothetical protein EAZ78_08050 [Oscillatoriales cyanobacterium]TAF46093.1 MAG: hypothetical protein EAZ68_04265 [Oscillatoriales cyanobacterium]TAF63702.1 MAG: hypothetical protein EAZ59_20480 [Oscillatoriales cyanobacterium]